MAMVPINKLEVNPHRDFELYPIDPEQVDDLQASIMRSGKPDFWGGVVGRTHPENPSTYQIAAGHHRVEAARAAGLKRIEMHISDYDDEAMLDIMVAENATQMGHNAAAFADSVAAIIRELAYVLLAYEWEDLIGGYAVSPPIFETKVQFAQARTSLLKGEIGRRTIAKRAHNQLSEREIREAVNTLKDTGKIGQIVTAVQGVIETELAEAEEEERLAQEVAEKEEAKKKRKKKQAAKENADEAVEHTSKETLIDGRVVPLFSTPAQLTAFRQAMTTNAAQRFFPKDQHLNMAKQMMKEITRNTGRKDSTITGAHIKNWIQGHMAEAVAKQREITKEEAREAEREQAQQSLDNYIRMCASSMRSVIGYTGKISDMLDKYPELNTPFNFSTMDSTLNDLGNSIAGLKKLQAVRQRRAK